jgi:hypothetical protein
MVVDLAVAEQTEEAVDLLVAHRAPKSNAINIIDRHEHRGFVRHAELIEPARRAHDRFGFDLLDYAETVIRVDDLVADLKCHEAPSWV